MSDTCYCILLLVWRKKRRWMRENYRDLKTETRVSRHRAEPSEQTRNAKSIPALKMIKICPDSFLITSCFVCFMILFQTLNCWIYVRHSFDITCVLFDAKRSPYLMEFLSSVIGRILFRMFVLFIRAQVYIYTHIYEYSYRCIFIEIDKHTCIRDVHSITAIIAQSDWAVEYNDDTSAEG